MRGNTLSSVMGENLIRNALLDIWQRGTSYTSIADTQYFADRLAYYKSGTLTAVNDINQSTDVPTEAISQYSADITVTTAQSSLAASDYANIEYRMEGYDLRKLKGRYGALQFWVKSSQTGAHSVAFRNSALNRSFVKEYVVNQAGTWEKKVVLFKHDITGTWDYIKNIGMRVTFSLAAGTDLQTSTLDEWQSANYMASSNQVNLLASTSDYLKITEMSINEGVQPLDTNKLYRPFDQEVALCQRYYRKSYELDTVPGTATELGGFGNGWSNTNDMFKNETFNVPMRTTPALTFYDFNGTQNTMHNYFGGTGGQNVTDTVVSKEGFAYGFFSSGTAWTRAGQYVANSEL